MRIKSMKEKDVELLVSCIAEYDRLQYMPLINDLTINNAKTIQKYLNERIKHCIECSINSKAYKQAIKDASLYIQGLTVLKANLK